MKKRILIFCIGLLATLLLTGCNNIEGNPLPAGMDEAAVLETGREVVANLNAGNYEDIFSLMREDAKTATGSAAVIQAHMEAALEKVGPYVSEETAMATGQTLKESGEEYATAVFYCKHEKNQAMYRVAFSTEMELLGLQVTKQ